MELDEYLRILVRRWPVWLGTIVIAMALAAGYVVTRPASFDAFTSISFVKKAVPVANRGTSYEFDNFYSLQSSQLLAQMAAGWLADPVQVATLYRAAKVALPTTGLSRLSHLLRVGSLGGATIQIQATAETSAAAETLARQAQTFVSDRMTALAADGTLDPMTVLGTAPISEPTRPSLMLYLAAALVVGIILGFLFAFLAESVRGRAE